MTIILSLFLLSLAPQAQEVSAFQRQLEADTRVETKEQWIHVGVVRYRQIEFQGDDYFLTFNRTPGKSVEIDCKLGKSAKRDTAGEATQETGRRPRTLIVDLRKACTTAGDARFVDVSESAASAFPGAVKSRVKVSKDENPNQPQATFSRDW